MTGTITKVTNASHGEIRTTAGALVKFSRSALHPASYGGRGASVGDEVEFELMFPGVAGKVWLQ